MNNIHDKITEKYETWSEREYTILEHLSNVYKAQDILSEIEAYMAITRTDPEKPSQKEYQLWLDFLKPYNKTLKLARVKALKSSDHGLTEIISHAVLNRNNRMTISEYDDTLFAISCLYDQLGYSSPERKVIKSPFISDIEIGLRGEDVIMEAMD